MTAHDVTPEEICFPFHGTSVALEFSEGHAWWNESSGGWEQERWGQEISLSLARGRPLAALGTTFLEINSRSGPGAMESQDDEEEAGSAVLGKVSNNTASSAWKDQGSETI